MSQVSQGRTDPPLKTHIELRDVVRHKVRAALLKLAVSTTQVEGNTRVISSTNKASCSFTLFTPTRFFKTTNMHCPMATIALDAEEYTPKSNTGGISSCAHRNILVLVCVCAEEKEEKTKKKDFFFLFFMKRKLPLPPPLLRQ
jgi:hypothetical protein